MVRVSVRAELTSDIVSRLESLGARLLKPIFRKYWSNLDSFTP